MVKQQYAKTTTLSELQPESEKCYVIDFLLHLDEEKAQVSNCVQNDLFCWHKRFGHLGFKNLEHIIKNELVDGMKIDTKQKSMRERILCGACIEGKQTRLMFKESTKPRSSRRLELVHTDVCG